MSFEASNNASLDKKNASKSNISCATVIEDDDADYQIYRELLVGGEWVKELLHVETRRLRRAAETLAA